MSSQARRLEGDRGALQEELRYPQSNPVFPHPKPRWDKISEMCLEDMGLVNIPGVVIVLNDKIEHPVGEPYHSGSMSEAIELEALLGGEVEFDRIEDIL